MMLVKPEEWRLQGIEDLEPAAWRALCETGRSVCVTAGPGAGKTEFLAQKAAYLLQTGLCPWPRRILAISFKRDAARNLAERVRSRCSPEQARRFDSMTFDAFTKGMLDRFRMALPQPWRPTSNYRIIFPSKRDFDHFLQRHGQIGINSKFFEKEITRTALPLETAHKNQGLMEIIHEYWKEHLEMPDGSQLSFPMINRLVEYLLRINPRIRRALHLTYPHVFLDEFQDTTCAQYELMQTAFNGSDTVFTAVGDDKQRIMGWAGAMDNAFEKFVADYNAVRHELICNWRSHADLARIQQVMAKRIDPQSGEVDARGELAVDGDVAAIWQFDSRENELKCIAAWIAHEIAEGRVAPHEVAVLVRRHANDVEKELGPALACHGLILRNIARNVGNIAIQDLLSEPFTESIIPILRLGSCMRAPQAWNAAQESMQILTGVDPDDELKMRRLQRELLNFTRDLQQHMHSSVPDPETAHRLLEQVLEFVGPQRLQQAFPEYRREEDFQRVREGFRLLLQECAKNAAGWGEVLDRFEGKGQVPLMTIHKSKGLEFHTMIFFGFDSQTWRSLNPNNIDELKAFFVAFTRARQRAFFTYCVERGGEITWLRNMLLPAGVKIIRGSDIIS